MSFAATPLPLSSAAQFLGFEMISPSGGRRQDRRLVPGAGTATLTATELRFRGERLDQVVAIPLGDVHAVVLASSHNGRRWWSGKVVKVSFGGGDTRVLGLHLATGDAAVWRDQLGRLVGRSP